MAEIRVAVGQAQQNDYPLSFNDIIAHVPGRPGRGDAKKGMFEHRNGDILVVYSKNPQFVECERRANGRRTTRTGFTRTGMMMIDKSTGNARLVAANRDPDGERNWREYTGSITLAGNPHVVPDPAPAGAEGDAEDYEE